MDTQLTDQIRNEEILMQKLNNLNIKAVAWHTSIINAFWGEKSKEYANWADIGKEIDETPLTTEGKLRLMVKHDLMKERLLPRHSVLLLSLLPIVGYWAVKKGITYVISQRLERYSEEHKRLKRQQEKLRQRLERKKQREAEKPVSSSKSRNK